MVFVKLTYFDPGGRYYSEGTYISKLNQEHELVDEVRLLPFHPDKVFSTNTRWNGYILITCEEMNNFRRLIVLEKEE